MESTVQLYLPREILTPQDDLLRLAAHAEKYGVTTYGTSLLDCLNRSRRDVQTLFVADTYGDLGLSSKQSWLRAFESEVASYLCIQDSLFTPSGVMAQEMALCIYRERKYSGDAMLLYDMY